MFTGRGGSVKYAKGLDECINGSVETRHMTGHSKLGLRWAFVAYSQHSLDRRYEVAQ